MSQNVTNISTDLTTLFIPPPSTSLAPLTTKPVPGNSLFGAAREKTDQVVENKTMQAELERQVAAVTMKFSRETIALRCGVGLDSCRKLKMHTGFFSAFLPVDEGGVRS